MFFLFSRLKEFEIKNINKIYTFEFNKILFSNNINVKYIKFNHGAKGLKIISKKIENIYKIQLKNLTNFFNFLYKNNNDKRYYEILLGYWLVHYISQFIFKSYIIDKSPRFLKHVKINFNKKIIPEDNNDFLNLCYTDQYQHYLFSQVIEYKKIKNIYELDYKYYEDIKTNNKLIYKKLIKNIFILFLYLFKPRVVIVDPYFKNNIFLNKFKLMLFSKFNIMFYNFDLKSPKKKFFNSLDWEDLTLPSFITDKKFFKLILRNIPLNNRFFMNNDLKYPIFLKNCKKFVSFNAHYFNNNFQNYMSKNLSNSKYYFVQHGAGYGIEQIHFPEKFDKSVSDEFYYIMRNRRNKNIYIPCPLNELNVNWYNNKKILFISTSRHKYFIRPLFTADIRNHFIKDNNCLFKFYKKLKLKEHIYYRFNNQADYSSTNLFKENCKKNNIKIDQNKSIYESFRSAKVCLYDHIGTSFFESIQFNLPSIIIIDDKFKEYYNYKFTRIINLLIKAKIIFTSPEEACEFLNKNYFFLDKWWNSEPTTKARNTFINSYCSHSNKWYKNWIDEFLNE